MNRVHAATANVPAPPRRNHAGLAARKAPPPCKGSRAHAPAPDALLTLIADAGISGRTFSPPPPQMAAVSRALRGTLPGAQARNLFLRDSRKTCILVTLAEDARVKLKRFKALHGARGSLSFASAEVLRDMLGVMPGSVTLPALIHDRDHRVTVGIDTALLEAEAVGCHPLTSGRSTGLTSAAPEAFFTLTGHGPPRLDLVAAPDADAPTASATPGAEPQES